jgi:hypothetical protein
VNPFVHDRLATVTAPSNAGSSRPGAQPIPIALLREVIVIGGAPVPTLVVSDVELSSVQQDASGPRPRDKVVRLPNRAVPDYSFSLRQQWEGVVVRVDGDEFTAVLRDLVDPRNPEYEAILPVEDVDSEDAVLLKPGAVLYWSIGYERTRTGQYKRVSILRLRRMPAWSRRDVQNVTARTKALLDRLGIDDEEQSSQRKRA